MDVVYISTIAVTIMFVMIAGFQVLLSLGYPVGEFAMGGFYKVLPKKLRIVSAANAILLLFMGYVFLSHSKIINGYPFIPTTILIWIFTIFLGLNTVANLISQSKKEKLVMTPLSSIAFVLCLIIAAS
ncbi:hypothetical protein D8M04_19235 [Oceanobacillus piezotolerans]|uniref:Integral membrane protein n=1 Tax=Oceanobacillus piezotolerans TaxID=2448030 RepID=A0A498D228_9BACI|nr:hypothetical protein [Oceanobacillus piezotolerans]RLL40372.1 hypothetical protein D8M04_19235 [Oceanobacillus piezotolerans]